MMSPGLSQHGLGDFTSLQIGGVGFESETQGGFNRKMSLSGVIGHVGCVPGP